ncbi:hypothetical protein [Marinobacter sp. HL-58]|uniref:hypothetical protein n=1 Tax=Marinobacter sp. HL-58 TaxID=1479237 RepID=UPI0006DB3999|nr:hypothetical protein [Marinobacter sp. HL-58]KPQ00265.1 MAG: class II bacteriocin [Marinobacter sp. HL-58]
MRELNMSEVNTVSGGYGTLGPGGGSDPGNQLNDYGVDAGGLRYTPESTRRNIGLTVGVAGAMSSIPAVQAVSAISTLASSWNP